MVPGSAVKANPTAAIGSPTHGRPQLAFKFVGVLNSVSVAIVIKVGPDPLAPGFFDTSHPHGEFRRAVIMPIPFCHSMKTDIHLLSRVDEHVWQFGAAAGTENCP